MWRGKGGRKGPRPLSYHGLSIFASFPSISFFNIQWFWFEGESGVLGVREEEEEEEEEEQPIRWLEDRICWKKN